MKCKRKILLSAMLMVAYWSIYAVSQSDDDTPPAAPLGDVARALRRDKEKDKVTAEEPSAKTVIDNENLTQVMDQAEKDRSKGDVKFIFDGLGKDIKVAAPDVTCSLSFSGKAGALVSDPFVPQDIPRNELANLDGPAVMNGDALQITVHNGTAWNLREITVSLTILRPSSSGSSASAFGAAKLVPASDKPDPPSGKRSDFTVLYHIKGTAAPGATTVFRQELGGKLDSDQEWHWAIVQAQGIPPK